MNQFYIIIIYMSYQSLNKTRKTYPDGINEPTGNPPVGSQENQLDSIEGSPEIIQPEQPTNDSPEIIQEGPVETDIPPPSNEFPTQSPPLSENTNELEEPSTVPTENVPPVDQSFEIEDFRQKMADPANQIDYLFLNPNISTEPNKNKSYVRVGLFHFTDSAAINVLRDTITSFGNLFGNKGVDNIIYDKLRNTVLTKVGIILGENRRCYNTTVQIERIDDNIFAHVYGTLYEKKE